MISPKTEAEIKLMAEGGRLLAQIREALIAATKEGIILKELDQLAEKLFKEAGGKSAFLGYQPEGAKYPYPASICVSVNEIVVHGPPTAYRLRSGDILKIDLGFLYKGFYTDTAVTIGIGIVSAQAKKLISATKKSLELALAECQPGKKLGDIGAVINKYVQSQGFSVIKGLTGHGIGRELHEDPVVFNDGQPHTGPVLKPGLVIAIEPMVSAGGSEIQQLPNESYATKDGSLTAHFEHTVAITENGYRVLTL